MCLLQALIPRLVGSECAGRWNVPHRGWLVMVFSAARSPPLSTCHFLSESAVCSPWPSEKSPLLARSYNPRSPLQNGNHASWQNPVVRAQGTPHSRSFSLRSRSERCGHGLRSQGTTGVSHLLLGAQGALTRCRPADSPGISWMLGRDGVAASFSGKENGTRRMSEPLH